MATQQDIGPFQLGETWGVVLNCQTSTGAVLNLTGAQAAEIMFSPQMGGSPITVTLTNGATILPPATNGQVGYVVAPSAQAALSAGCYQYEARVILSDGTVSTQSYGCAEILPSLFPIGQ